MYEHDDEYEEFDAELVCKLMKEEILQDQKSWIESQYKQFF